MGKHYQINNEKFRCEMQARRRLQDFIFEVKQQEEHQIIELWEVSEQEDIFGNRKILKQLVTRYTHNLPNNGFFRIHDSFDIRKSKKLYSLQKYDSENHCWNNFKMGDDLKMLIHFMNSFSEVE